MKPYIELYRRWIAVPGVQAADIAVLSALYAHADQDGVCAATQGELAEELGQSRSWIHAVLKALQEPQTALVASRTRRGFRGFLYEITGAAADVADRNCRPADNRCSPDERSPGTGNPESSFSSGGGMDVLPSDWQPDADDLAWAGEQRPDVDAAAVTGKFVAWCRKTHRRNGYKPADPNTAWRRWILRELVAPVDDRGADPIPSPTLPCREFRHERRSRRPPADSPPGFVQRSGQGSGPGSGEGSGCDGAPLVARNQNTLAALRHRLASPA